MFSPPALPVAHLFAERTPRSFHPNKLLSRYPNTPSRKVVHNRQFLRVMKFMGTLVKLEQRLFQNIPVIRPPYLLRSQLNRYATEM